MKYMDMLKRKGSKKSDGTSTSEKSDQAGVVEEADSIHVMSGRLSQEKINTQMVGYLTRGVHTTCTQKESGSVLTSLMMEALS